MKCMACDEDGIKVRVISRSKFKEKPWWYAPLCEKHLLIFAERGFGYVARSNRAARKYMVSNGWIAERSGFKRPSLEWESV